ncbi:MAG: M20 family metallopeptidase [Ruminococcaceae bacterium]|nr:M20 family metallopeptidase [Oscillospiraceae bacterium]
MYRKQIESYFEKNTEAMVNSIARLVDIPSVREAELPGKPFGEGPAAALAEALKMGQEMGFETRNIDNYAGVIEMGGEAKVAILAHLDVVEPGDGWDTDPFKMVMKDDGRIYGRGTSDDKGPAVAALYAMAAVREICPDLGGVRLVLGCAEETGSECMDYYMKKEPLPTMVFSPDAEFPVINIEKGGYGPRFSMSWEKETAEPRVISFVGGKTPNIVPGKATAVVAGLDASAVSKTADALNSGAVFTVAEDKGTVTILCEGKPAHASTPEEGINAQTALLKLLASLPLADGVSADAVRRLNRLFPHGDWQGEAIGIKMADDISGSLTLAFSVIDMNETGFTALFDSRVPICGNEDNVAAVAEKNLKAEGFTVDSSHMRPPHHVPEDSVFVRTLLKAYEKYSGRKGECIAIGGGTYVHEVEGGVAFGCTMPGTETNLHGANESMPVEELVLSGEMFAEVILELCGK